MQRRRLAFPIRSTAICDQVKIGAGGNTSYHYRTEEDLLGPIDVPLEISEPIEIMRARIPETVGEVTVPKKILTGTLRSIAS